MSDITEQIPMMAVMLVLGLLVAYVIFIMVKVL